MIIEKGKVILPELISLYKYMCTTTDKVWMIREGLEKEKEHWDQVHPLVMEMGDAHSQVLVIRKKFNSPSEDLSHVWVRTLSSKYEMLNQAIDELDSNEEHAFKIQDNINIRDTKTWSSCHLDKSTTEDELLRPFE
ncbi:hypothetical protein KI387_004218, partial [Taxus chinensis]